MRPRIVIIAGEASGDQLAGGLIEALRAHYPDAIFEGITGPQMRAAGCESWGDYEQLAVMGLVEVLRHIPRLWRLKRDIERRLRADPPDLFIGIDAPDFTLRIEKSARRAGIKTVHYVCPSVWAWRSSRVRTLQAACDLVLCLLPFEKQFLDENGVAAVFVGHPLADAIQSPPPQDDARRELNLGGGELVAMLPGSRMGDVRYLGPAFVDTAKWLLGQRPDLRFVVPAASDSIRAAMEILIEEAGLAAAFQMVDGRAREVMAAADVILLASGTATLEAMLVARPMVVAYKVSALTAWLLRNSGLVKVDRFSLPNLLADETLVAEILQEEATGPVLGAAVLKLLNDAGEAARMVQRFHELGGLLRRDASARAAAGVYELLQK
jgi:lipid-A-disaccharide synthase